MDNVSKYAAVQMIESGTRKKSEVLRSIMKCCYLEYQFGILASILL